MTAEAAVLSAPPTTSSDRFQRYRRAVGRLRAEFPRVFDLLRPRIDPETLEGWAAMLRRHDAFEQQGGEPALVATLYGPTGAGKSTLFRMLTEVQVPAGDDVRPVSYASVIIVPERVNDSDRLAQLLPSFRLEALHDVEQLRRPENNGKVFHLASAAMERSGGPMLLLADVPDFNSVAEQNWEACQKVLERAEVVVFVTHPESYADKRVFGEMARCCRLSAAIVFVLTKAPSPEAAKRIWKDLIESKINKGLGPHAEAFREERADGRALHDFLGQCPVYFSLRSKEPKLEELRPLVEGRPPITSFLQGMDADNLLLSGLVEPAWRAISSSRGILREARSRIEELERALKEADAPIAPLADRVAGSEFPVGRMMEILFEEAGYHQIKVLRIFTAPFRGFNSVFKKGKALLAGVFQAGNKSEVRGREEIEVDRLAEASEDLLDKWRGHFSGAADAKELLSNECCKNARGAFTQLPVPKPQKDWERVVRMEVAAWAKKHPWLCNTLPVVAGALVVGGFSLLALDLVTTGGLFGSAVLAGNLGLAGAAAAGSGSAGLLMQWAENWQLKQVFLEADKQWREQRARELTHHLRAQLAAPLFKPWREQLEQLKQAPISVCEEACTDIEELAQGLGRRA